MGAGRTDTRTLPTGGEEGRDESPRKKERSLMWRGPGAGGKHGGRHGLVSSKDDSKDEDSPKE